MEKSQDFQLAEIHVSMSLQPNSVVRTYCIFLGEQMLLVVLGNNSGLF